MAVHPTASMRLLRLQRRFHAWMTRLRAVIAVRAVP